MPSSSLFQIWHGTLTTQNILMSHQIFRVLLGYPTIWNFVSFYKGVIQSGSSLFLWIAMKPLMDKSTVAGPIVAEVPAVFCKYFNHSRRKERVSTRVNSWTTVVCSLHPLLNVHQMIQCTQLFPLSKRWAPTWLLSVTVHTPF